MTKFKICKSRMMHFEFVLTFSEILAFQIFDLENVGLGHGLLPS